MSVARLVIPPHPAPASVFPPREEAERLASIVRKYATDSVAIDATNALQVDLRHVPWPCAEPERARRLAVLASAWAGRRVDVRTGDAAPANLRSPFAATLRKRPGEAPAAFRDRIRSAAERLALMVETHGLSCRRWMLRLDRDGARATMPLPGALLEQDPRAFEQRLPAAALENVIEIRLEARTGAPVHRRPQPAPHTAKRSVQEKPLAKVS